MFNNCSMDSANDSPNYYASHNYSNGDKYTGEFTYDQPNGYGVYRWANGKTYKGFFMDGISYGTGTLECNRYITKGNWFKEMQHGEFRKTDKIECRSYLEYWKMNKLIKSTEIQYIAPMYLSTRKYGVSEDSVEKKSKLTKYNGQEKKCVGCYDKIADMAVVPCGHVIMCAECLNKCECCPICRCTKKNVLRLYMS